MQTNIQKWGNSLALRIPAAYAKDVGFKEGTRVKILINKKQMCIEPVSQVPEYSLDELLKGINKENLHGEINTGCTVGQEFF